MKSLAATQVLEQSAYLPSVYDEPRTRRQLGSFYTPHSAAEYMAQWIVRNDDERILEPSFGDGIFLKAVSDVACQKDFENLHCVGSELDPVARWAAIDGGLIDERDAHLGDFLSTESTRVDAVIGNPPYVRLRHLTKEQRSTALEVASESLSGTMDPSGSTWMPFLIHSMNHLRIGGRIAFVLPYELTHVRYARQLWSLLAHRFGSIHVQRTHQRLFPELLQDVIILFLDNYGGRTESLRFECFERVKDLVCQRFIVNTHLSINDICNGKRVFTKALLDQELKDLLETTLDQVTAPAGTFVSFGIGYVAGDKKFFHPNQDTVKEHRIPSSSLISAITSGRSLKGGGLRTSCIEPSTSNSLFLPNPVGLSEEEEAYIAVGESTGVSKRYKCQIRSPWYVVPGVRVPDVILGVFTERPIFVVNDANYVASNSLLAGMSKGWTGENLATRWYTSLTLLQCELEVHALGGGVMVMVPTEANRVRLPRTIVEFPEHSQRLNQLLREGKVSDAYQVGDREILLEQMGLSRSELNLIEQGVETLAHWRTSSRSSRKTHQ